MAKVTVVTKKGTVLFEQDAHVSMEPDSREVAIIDNDSTVLEIFTYDEVDDITVEHL